MGGYKVDFQLDVVQKKMLFIHILEVFIIRAIVLFFVYILVTEFDFDSFSCLYRLMFTAQTPCSCHI